MQWVGAVDMLNAVFCVPITDNIRAEAGLIGGPRALMSRATWQSRYMYLCGRTAIFACFPLSVVSLELFLPSSVVLCFVLYLSIFW